MIVKLMLFARAKEMAGSSSLEFTLDDDARVGDLKRCLVEQYPSLMPLIDQSTFSVDQQYANDDRTLYHGCEVAIIPPVSGG